MSQLPPKNNINLEKKAHQTSPDPRIQTLTDNMEKMQQNIEAKIETKMRQSEDKIDEMILSLKRPDMGGISADLQTKQHDEAFGDYIRYGRDQALRSLDQKAYNVIGAGGGEGGYLVSPNIQSLINHKLTDLNIFRSLAHNVNISQGTIDFMMDPDQYGANWAAETHDRHETSTGIFRKVSIMAHDLYAMPKATQRILDDSAFNIENWIAMRVAEKFAYSEQAAFIYGDGADKPHGFLSKPQNENINHGWGNIGYIKTGDADDLNSTNPQDVLLDVIYALPSRYRQGAVFLMNSKTEAALRKIKDTQGRYILSERSSGVAATLFGYSLHICEEMPNIGTDTTPIAFGNFSRAYAVVDHGTTTVLRDPYSAKPNIFFYVKKRVGGDVIDYHAIKLVKCQA